MQISFQNKYHNEISRTATHLFLRPHPRLRPFIAHYTLMLPGAAQTPGILNLIPDLSGCFVFTFDPDAMKSRLYGATTRIVKVSNDTNRHLLRLFVEFVPGGLSCFTGNNQKALADQIFTVSDVCPGLEQEMEAAFLQRKNLDDFIQEIDKKLIFHQIERKPSAAFEEAVYRLKQLGGRLSIKQLSQEVGYSERHLNRLFLEGIGVSTKKFSKILRFNRAMASIRHCRRDFAMLAQDAGFYDQSHLIRDFKNICGATPGEVLLRLSVFYNEPLKFRV